MKKGNRVLALFLSIVLVLTGIAWDFSDVEATGTESAATEAGHSGLIEFDDVDVTTLNEHFTSTRLNSSSYAVVGDKDQAVESHWSSDKTLTNSSSLTVTGIKPLTHRDDNRHNLLKYNDTYKDFKLTVKFTWGSNIGIIIGDAYNYPLAGATNGIMIYPYGGDMSKLCIRGAIETSSAKSTGILANTSVSSNACYFKVASKALGATTQTINVRVEDSVLRVWVDNYDEVFTVNIKDTYPEQSNISLWAMGYSNNISFRTFEAWNLSKEGYTNFDGVDVSTLNDNFSSTKLDEDNSFAVINGEQDQAVEKHWSSRGALALNGKYVDGIKPLTHRDDREYNLLKYNNAYKNFELSVKLTWGTNVAIVLGEKYVYPSSASTANALMISPDTRTASGWKNLRIRGAIDTSTASVEGTLGTTSVDSSNYSYFQVSDKSLYDSAQTVNIKMLDGVLTVSVDGYDEVYTVNVANTYPSWTNISLWAIGYSNNISFREFEIHNLDDAYAYFDGVDVSTLNSKFTSTQLDEDNQYAIIAGQKDKTVESHWSSDASLTGSSKKVDGIKPLTHRDDRKYNLLKYNDTYEDFQLSVTLTWGTNIGIVLGNAYTYPLKDTKDTILIAPDSSNFSRLRIRGGIAPTTASAEGTLASVTTSDSQSFFKVSENSLGASTQTIHIKKENRVLTIWVDGYKEVYTVNVASTYPDGTNVSLWAIGYSNAISFRDFAIRGIECNNNTGTAVDVDGYTDFDKVDVSVLEEKGFTATQFDSSTDYAIVGVDKPVSTYWVAGADLKSSNNGLKPITVETDKKMTFLNTPYKYENFKLSTEVYWGSNTGVVLGEKNVFPTSDTASSIRIYFNSNQIQLVGGGLDYDVKYVSGGGTWNAGYAPTYIFKPTGDFEKEAGKVYILNVQLLDDVLTVWLEGYEGRLEVKVSDTFKNESIALVGRNYDSDGGGFKSLTVKELGSATKPQVQQAQPGECFSEEFLPSDTEFKITDLEEDFSAYYYAEDEKKPESDKLSFRWANTKWGIRPTHNRASKAQTLLTYNKLAFKNVEITTKYQRNWGQYAIMIAPEGEIATVENHGIKAWVESDGRIRVTGAIDAGSATSTGGYVTILGKNMIAGYNISDYANKATDKFYNLHVKIEGDLLQIWMDEVPEYIISVKVTEDYQGGLVSLYSDGNNDGGYGSFTAIELKEAEAISGVYTQSFSDIDSLDELTDFTAYSLKTVKDTPTQVKISEAFRLAKGRMQAISPENGKDDRTNWSILTLNNKTYKNFEMTVHYEQSRMQRYAVMFGTELGEFAYSETGSRLSSNGGTLVFTEAEGYRNVKSKMYASFYTKGMELLHRDRGDEKLNSFWWYNNDVMNNVQRKTLHTMTIRVVGEYMTMIIDNDESSRVTVRLADYNGGYVSLVSNAAANEYGAFAYMSIKELSEDADLGTEKPGISAGYEIVEDVDKDFDAYYLKDAKESSKMEKVDMKEHWWVNQGGFVSRATNSSGYTVEKDVEVLTYTKQTFTDFEMTYTYHQNWLRLGVLIGEDMGEYPLSYVDGKLTADKGAVVFLEAEGYTNVQGHLYNMTKTDQLLYRTTKTIPEGFKDGNGKADGNIGKEHTVKIVVKDRALYVFIDGNTEPAGYVNLGENYKGGYVSMFAHTGNAYGFSNFSITDKVTTTLPKGGGTSVSGNTFTADFSTAKFDDSAFTTYYLAHTKGNAEGIMEKQNFEDQWTIDNGVLESNTRLTTPSSKNLTEFEWDDSTMVSVLTYNKKLTDFVVSYDYTKTWYRSMFMFGTEMGKFALAAPNTTQKGQGVLIYPENDLGAGGGLVALGSLATYNNDMRPQNRALVKVKDYHEKGNWNSNVGDMHTMTVAVISGHCYIYLDDYGLIADYELEDYEGGYVSLATSGRNYQYFGVNFDNLRITDLSTLSENDIIAGQNPSDITVLVGTDVSALGLPTSVKATTKTGKTVDVPVTWKSLNYNPSEAGVYQFTAVLDEKTNVGVKINIRVVTEMPKMQAGVKYWTFDTEEDLKDFKAYYLKNADTGYITEGVPNWYVNSSGRLTRDPFRAINGDQYKELAILTYTGEKYTNFELEVEYTQQWQRLMVLFGSEKVGQYIDLKDIYAASNPVAGYVEMEGVRNFIGNLINANFDSNDKEKINNARESGVRLENYYDEVLSGGNQGKRHTMKIRVVGDQAMMWVDDAKDPYVCTLTNYDGGYISLVTTSKSSSFDNLKITRLNAKGEPVTEDPNAIANGTMNVAIDENASTELLVPKREKAEGYGDAGTDNGQGIVIPTIAYVIGGSTILLALVIGTLVILTALKKKKQKEEN